MTTNNGFLSRDGFAAIASKRRFKSVYLPDGSHCRIRSISELEWADIDVASLDKKGQFSRAAFKQSDARLIAATVVDGEGQPIFGEADVESIMGFDVGVVAPLIRQIKEHCGLLRGVEDAEKNLGGTVAAGSPSSS